jgi:hypothetical protein
MREGRARRQVSTIDGTEIVEVVNEATILDSYISSDKKRLTFLFDIGGCRNERDLALALVLPPTRIPGIPAHFLSRRHMFILTACFRFQKSTHQLLVVKRRQAFSVPIKYSPATTNMTIHDGFLRVRFYEDHHDEPYIGEGPEE